MFKHKHKRESVKQSQRKKYFYLFSKLALFVFLFYLFYSFKPLIIILVFELLDFFKNLLKQTIPYLPLDCVFVFGVTASYYYGFIYSVIIFFLGILNRIIMSCIEVRHISKAIRHIPIFFLVTFFISFNFFIVAMAALIINYFLKYLLKIAQGDIDIEKTQFYIVNFILATITFYFISILYFYLPFLAA